MAKRFRQTSRIILALALLAGFFSACGTADRDAETPVPEETGAQTGEQDYYKADSVFSLNCDKAYSFSPFTTKNVSNILCTQLMYDTLFAVDDSFAALPNLIKSYETADGKSWKFYVDTSVKFWDGTTLTASDASYSVQRATQSARFSARLKGVIGSEALDEELFIINLYYPDMLFPALLDIPVIKNGSVDEPAPTGTGPYMPDEGLTKLEAFTGHKNYASLPADTVYLREIRETEDMITAFENSEIDLVTNDPSSAFNLGYGSANEVRHYPTTNMQYLGFNGDSQFFSSIPARKAMTYVVDRERIVTDCLSGAASAATLPMNPTCLYYNDAFSDIVSYSVRKSEDAFDEAEVQDYDDDGKREQMITGIPMEISIDFIVCSDTPAKVRAAESIAENLTGLGITVELRRLSWDDYVAALAAGAFDMYYAEVRLTNDFSLRNLLFSGGSLNYGKFSDSVLEQHISDFMAAGDEDRQKAADLMFKYIADTAPLVPICFEKHQVITHRGVISGMRPADGNIFYGIENWEIHTD
ncbi:MAG: ABC transporter substrate-binding protein [Oscillospiraceae bacterium]|jgi:peptide/nickel transport system substrate-binding protein|nr:ABC transporter substrate-binding protein [Oscillospiraceae bacterium]